MKIGSVSTLFVATLFALPAALVLPSSAPTASAEVALPITADGILLNTNAERYREGVPVLKQNEQLALMARRKLVDMFARQYFAHESPTGESAGDLAKAVGYEYMTVGENLALGGFTSSKDVVDAWMNSPGHRENILKPTYTEIGIAAARGTYEGRRVWIAVQEFGLPRTACPKPSESLAARIENGEKLLALLKRIVEARRVMYETAARARTSEAGARYEAYVRSVDLYNKHAATYRPLVREYNKNVEAGNTCIKKYLAE